MFDRLFPPSATRWIVIFICVAAGAAAGFLAKGSAVTRALIGWDAGVLLFIAVTATMMIRSDLETLKRRAKDYDGGRVGILAMTVVAVAVCIGAIISELSGGALKEPGGGWLAIFTIGTIFLSWVFVHLMFALHYAHEYYEPYEDEPAKGLKFPGDEEPVHGDFVHFSFVIGCAQQTADVEITAQALRRIVTVHCIVAFMFNTTIIAFLINISASVISGN